LKKARDNVNSPQDKKVLTNSLGFTNFLLGVIDTRFERTQQGDFRQ